MINDTLDPSLDWNSFDMIESSHSYQLSIDSLSRIKWAFKDVLLPDSNTNEEMSHGFICFRIKPRSSISPATIITNKSSIYFDYNAPVVTNACETEFALPTAENYFEKPDTSLMVYPNPADDRIYVSCHGYNQFHVVDILGNEILNGNFYDQITFSVNKWTTGIYFLTVRSAKFTSTRKIIVN